MAVLVNPKFASDQLTDFINRLPDSFANAGTQIYKGRNTVKCFLIDGNELIVKKFHPLSTVRALLYLFRTSKATRAYRYGLEILRRGIQTPQPVAVINCRRGFMLHDSYFISLPTHRPDLTFLRQKDFDSSEAKSLSEFVYQLQQRGVLHGDLNLTNILLADKDAVDPLRRYIIIDTNRSIILPPGKKPSIRRRAQNIMRLTHRRDLQRTILDAFPLHSDTLFRLTFRMLFRQEARKRFLHRIFSH